MSDNNIVTIGSTPASGKWNWGAFLMNWIWGIGNKTYIALLCLIPGVNLVMIFVLGARGNQWAWKNNRWENAEHFNRVQNLWAAFGLGMLSGMLILLILFVVVSIITFNNVFM